MELWDLWVRHPNAKGAGNLVATTLGVSQIKLSWTALTDNASVTKDKVQRQDFESTSFVHVTTTTGTNYTDADGRGDQLQLSGPGKRCDRAFRTSIGGDERDNSFTNNRPSQITITKLGS